MDKICEVIDKAKGNNKIPCSADCKYYEKAFEHNKKACTLSDVFSVNIGEPCSTFEAKKTDVK